MKSKVVYYAHHMWKYDTQEEIIEADMINNHFDNPIIINPNGWIFDCGDEHVIMKQCLKLIENSDIFVFSTLSGENYWEEKEFKGIIGRGVYTEIRHAFKRDKKVFILKNDKTSVEEFTKEDFDDIEFLNVGSWKRFAKIINN